MSSSTSPDARKASNIFTTPSNAGRPHARVFLRFRPQQPAWRGSAVMSAVMHECWELEGLTSGLPEDSYHLQPAPAVMTFSHPTRARAAQAALKPPQPPHKSHLMIRRHKSRSVTAASKGHTRVSSRHRPSDTSRQRRGNLDDKPGLNQSYSVKLLISRDAVECFLFSPCG